MADSKLTALSEFTPVSTDIIYGVDDPGGTPISGKIVISALATLLHANATLTGLTTLTVGATNTGVIASTGYSLTGSDTTAMVSLAGTWNTSGRPTALNLNITKTAAADFSDYLRMQVGGVTYITFQEQTNFAYPRLWMKQGSTTSGWTIEGGDNTKIEFGVNGTTTGGPTYVARLDTGGAALASTGMYAITSAAANNGTKDTFLGRHAAASWRFGAADAASPVAQTIGVQSVVAGTSNTAGATAIIRGSIGTGTGAGGKLSFQTAPAGSTGSSQNSLVEAFQATINGTFGITDGITAPAAIVGVAQIFVDTADGDLKVIFGDGTTKLLSADT